MKTSGNALHHLSEIRKHRRNTARKDHSHKRLSQIKSEQNIGALEGVLLWLAKADLYVVSISTRHSRSMLSGLGAMVVFTALLAFVTSLYTLLSTLIGPDNAYRWPIAVLLAGIYTYGIILIDREIVGATESSWKTTIVRMIFAIFIAVAVSYPAKLKFFEGRIDAEIDTIISEQNSDLLERRELIVVRAESERDTQISNIQTQIDSYSEQIQSMVDEIAVEMSQRGGCGPRCESLTAQNETLNQRLESLKSQLADMVQNSSFSSLANNELEAIDQEISSKRLVAYDILYKIEALDRITAANTSALMVSWFLLGFFLLLEMVPLALKWSIGHTEYHYYINARNNINKQKIVSIANIFIQMMQDDPEQVFNGVPREITDFIAYMLEDESVDLDHPEDMLSTYSDAMRNREQSTDIASDVDDGHAENQSSLSEDPVGNRHSNPPTI